MTAQRVCTLEELTPNQAQRFVLDGIAIAVVLDDSGTVHAIGDTCTHGDISLSDGFVEEGFLECWAHGSKFSLTSGAPATLPAYEPVPVFEVTIGHGGVVSIDPQKTIPVG